MSEWLQALILGAIQGLTEFLPVSSSGHLVLFQKLLQGDFFAAGEEELFAVVLHLGTLLPILWFYRQDLGKSLASLRPDHQRKMIMDSENMECISCASRRQPDGHHIWPYR